MVVNIGKTAMLTISAANGYRPEAFIEDEAGNEIMGNSERLKLVGFHLSNRPDVSLHITETVRKVRRRYWVLRHLKRHGLNSDELVQVYGSILRSVIEFCSVVYGPLMTAEQSEDIERLQAQSLKIIYGFDLSYRQVLEKSGLDTLQTRREKALSTFANKCLNGNYSHWFPLNTAAGRTRESLKFKEEYARCDRLRNSPIFAMRRLLNREHLTNGPEEHLPRI
jgi:hypothetical protein